MFVMTHVLVVGPEWRQFTLFKFLFCDHQTRLPGLLLARRNTGLCKTHNIYKSTPKNMNKLWQKVQFRNSHSTAIQKIKNRPVEYTVELTGTELVHQTHAAVARGIS